MRSRPGRSAVISVGFVVGLLAAGCGGGGPLVLPAGVAGASGQDAAAGTSGAAGTGAAGAAGTGVAGGGAAGTGAAGAAGTGAAGTGITGTGCGQDAPAALVAGMLVRQTITTAGQKDPMCADARCGAWTDTREYFVRLPIGYDKNKAYPLVLEGSHCAVDGSNIQDIPAFDSTVIRVGLTPSAFWWPYHATNPSGGCFDDHEGDDSADFVLYETLYDQLAATLCFDRKRVFAAGFESGANLANQLGCKYAGDAKRPLRGIMPYSGGLPTDPRYKPTCTNAPIAGVWIHEVGDTQNPFTGNIYAMNRDLQVNGCTPAGVTYATAMFTPFPLPADATSCKKYLGCPESVPMIVCPLPSNAHGSSTSLVAKAWPAFLQLFDGLP